MKVFAKIALTTLSVALLGSAMIGCGGASNNDQGVAFSMDSLSIASPVQFLEDPESASSSGSVTGTVAVSNNMSTVGIRVQRVFLSYSIPGAEVDPPSTSVAVNATLAPVASTGDTSLPPGFGNGVTTASFSIPAISSSVRTFLAFNRTSLPELPFEMEVTAYVRGVTTAGAVIETNLGTTTITFTPDVIIPPESASSTAADF